VLDLLPFYSANLQVDQQESLAGVNAIGFAFATTLIVPANEVWLVQHFAVFVQTGAGASCQIAPAFRPALVNQVLGPYVSIAALEQGHAVTSGLPFIARQGSTFACSVKAIAGGPVQVNFACTYVPLRI
jgi:hypothetical protein